MPAKRYIVAPQGGGSQPAGLPTFSPGGGTYATTQTVTISCSTPSSSIYYTTDGTVPTYPVTGSTQLYTVPLTVAVSETLKAIAIAPGFTTSSISTAAYTITVINPMGINLSASGTGELAYEGLPLFKNGFRSARHLGTSTGLGGTINTAVTLTAAGWPAADFSCQLFSGNNGIPPWAAGTWKCGFTSLNGGAETISSALGATIANVVHGASTTFDLTPTGSNCLFNVTGTTGGVTNIWCYLPAYNNLSGIDNPTTAAAFTNEAIAHYRSYSHIRVMQCVNSWWNTTQATSGNRRTPSNCQVAYNVANDLPVQDQSGRALYNFTAVPTTGATSATLSNPWPLATGNYGIMLFNGGTYVGRFVTFTNGSTACNWSAGGGALPAPITAYDSDCTIGFERYPIEWFIALANACNIGLWINSPWYEDGSNGAAGSWSVAVCTYLASNWTSPGNIYFEDGNENWNGSYFSYFMIQTMFGIAGYPDFSHYVAYRRHTFANVARANLPGGWWGVRAFQVNGVQTSFGNGPFYQQATYAAMNVAYGNPSADVQYTACSPYTTPSPIGAADSIATIETTFTTTQKANRAVQPLENETIVGLSMIPNGGAIKMCSYEGGGQWNAVNANGNANVGAAIVNAGMVAPLQGLYNRMYSTGLDLTTHFGSGLANSSDSLKGCEDQLQSVTAYAAFVSNPATSSPAYSAISSYFNGFTHTGRNVITGSGSIVNGYDYAENNSDISTTPASFSQAGGNIYPHQQNGYISYVVYWTGGTSQLFALNVTFASVNAGVTTNVECNGSILFTGVAVTAGAGPSVVNVGNVTLRPTWNYITLGHAGAQTASINQLQFN